MIKSHTKDTRADDIEAGRPVDPNHPTPLSPAMMQRAIQRGGLCPGFDSMHSDGKANCAVCDPSLRDDFWS